MRTAVCWPTPRIEASSATWALVDALNISTKAGQDAFGQLRSAGPANHRSQEFGQATGRRHLK